VTQQTHKEESFSVNFRGLELSPGQDVNFCSYFRPINRVSLYNSYCLSLLFPPWDNCFSAFFNKVNILPCSFFLWRDLQFVVASSQSTKCPSIFLKTQVLVCDRLLVL